MSLNVNYIYEQCVINGIKTVITNYGTWINKRHFMHSYQHMEHSTNKSLQFFLN